MPGGRVDPFKNFRFRVEIDGITQAGFTECSGLGSHIEVIEVREGADPTSGTRKVPGRVTYPDIVLKWGVTASRELYNWHKSIIDGELQRKNGSVVLLDSTGQEAVRWHFSGGWPSKFEGPTLNAKGNDIAIESLTITCEKLELAD